MTFDGAQAQITQAVTGWEGVTAQPHRFGGVEYVMGKREIGHIHGDRWIDVPFPKRVRDELVAQGRADAHHLLADSGWITFRIHELADVERAIALLEKSYQLALKQRGRKR